MLNPDTGAPHTAHTTNPVPFILTGDNSELKFADDKNDGEQDPGALCDVAPTILALLVSVFIPLSYAQVLLNRCDRVFLNLKV